MADRLGVIIVNFCSAEASIACLDSLLAANEPDLRIVLADNGSDDGSLAEISAWLTARKIPFQRANRGEPTSDSQLILLDNRANLGYAGGVNAALDLLEPDPEIGWFWVLNPDMTVPASSLRALRAHLATSPRFSLLGGRVLYADGSARVQTDGGLVNRWTGVTHNVNLGRKLADSPLPDPAQLDFIMGGNMVASREFLAQTGRMREDYFLYYEEVDWAMRRGDLPLAHLASFITHHQAGATIGSATLDRPASAFSQYWKHRARLRYIARFAPFSLPVALGWTLAKAASLASKGQQKQALAMLRGAFGLPPKGDLVPRNYEAR